MRQESYINFTPVSTNIAAIFSSGTYTVRTRKQSQMSADQVKVQSLEGLNSYVRQAGVSGSLVVDKD